MLRFVRNAFICLLAFSSAFLSAKDNNKKIDVWATNADKSAMFARQKPLSFGKASASDVTITLDAQKKLQTMDGFGFAMTGGSAQHLMHMGPAKRAALLKELFATDGDNIGISYLRISIGSSDLNDHVFSYDDVPAGETDPSLSHFSLAPDQIDLIPVMKEVLAINPKIKILGSPWSAPAWMKTNQNVKGGNLKPEYYAAYAQYFVKYVQGMKAEGIDVDAITIQNEPLNEKNTPSMQLLAPDETVFIKNHLGPAFKAANIKTKIILYDHNCDVPEYPLSILNDPAANVFVDGSGFHLYDGDISALTKVHNAFPNKNLYFTEFMAVEPSDKPRISIANPVANIAVAATRNWSRNVLLWNLASNSKYEPHTDNGGCTMCQGAVTIDGNDITRNLAYYAIAHFSKFVRPGSVRIASDTPSDLPNVAFKTPANQTVLVIANTGKNAKTFNVRSGKKVFSTTLNAGAAATYIW